MAYEVLMPQLGLTMEEGTVSSWVKHEGDAVKAGDVLLEITTDKLTNEVTSEHDGVLLKIVAQEGEDIPVKGLLGYVGEAGEVVGDAAPAAPAAAAPAEEAPAAPAVPAPAPVADGKRIRISPLARKTAQKLGVDYTAIAGSGPSGRIRQADILTAAEAQKSAPAPAAPAPCHTEGGSRRAGRRRHGREALRYAQGRGAAYAAVPHGDSARYAEHPRRCDGADDVP